MSNVLSDLSSWVASRLFDRRSYPRKTVNFAVQYLPNPVDPSKYTRGVGMEVSAAGVIFALPDDVTDEEFTLIMTIRERPIRVRIKWKRKDPFTHNGVVWIRYASAFSGIAADDWDRIVRFVSDQPDPENKASDEIRSALEREDNAYRLLPLAVQKRLVDLLVQMQRLGPPVDDTPPLLKMDYQGKMSFRGVEVHRVNVHSRVRMPDETLAYDTSFAIDDNGGVAVIS